MKENRLEFSLNNVEEIRALGALIAQLNREQIPYSLRKDSFAVELTIFGGF